jgi:hypothetical protein
VQELESFANIHIDGAASRNEQFLEEIQRLNSRSGLELKFKRKKPFRGYPRLVAQVKLGTMLIKSPMYLVVHAEPVGRSLSVGYGVERITSPEVPGLGGGLVKAAQQAGNRNPENQRRAQIILDAFELQVFRPAVASFEG